MSQDFIDPYAVLQVHREASEDVVRAAYRAMAKEHHPDTGTGDRDAMVLINRARDMLLDPAKRSSVDAELDRRSGQSSDEEKSRPRVQGDEDSPSDWASEPENWEDDWGFEAEWEPEPQPQPQPVSVQQPHFPAHVAPAVTVPPAWYPAPPSQRRWDWVSIAAFVLTLTCYGAPIGFLLGMFGLFRTIGGRRRGVGFAAFATLAGTALVVLMLYVTFSERPTELSDVAVRDCLTFDTEWSIQEMKLASCADDHDAEVLAKGSLGRRDLKSMRTRKPEAFCMSRMPQAVRQRVHRRGADVRLLLSADRLNGPQRGDRYLCLGVVDRP